MSARTFVPCAVFFTCALWVMPAIAAEVALVPVSASGPFSLTNDGIILHGGDQTVTLEIRASEWTPARLKVYQAVIDSGGYNSGSAGVLHPLGWVGLAPEPNTCTVDGDCESGYECWFYEESAGPGFCALLGHDPEAGVLIDEQRTDFMFHGLAIITAIDLSVFDYRFGGLTTNYESAPEYTPPPKYCGTLILHASSDAAGTFTVGLLNGGDHTFMLDNENDFIPDVTLTPALITVNPAVCGNGICDSGEDAASCPEDCMPPPIPAASTWGLVALGLLIASLAKVYYARTREPARAT